MNIRKYFLITDTNYENPNPGDILIGKGIEYLLTEAECRLDNFPIFNYLNLFTLNKEAWERMYKEADYLVICGTPQFGLYGHGIPFTTQFFDYVDKAKRLGIPIANLWVGCGYPTYLDDRTKMIFEIAKGSKNVIERYKVFDLLVSRDKLTQEVLNHFNIPSELFIDSVFYSSNLYNIQKKNSVINLIVLRDASDTHKKIIIERSKEIKTKLRQDIPTFFLVHSIKEYLYYRPFFKEQLICCNNPKDLLELYSRSNEVVSLRVHGSVSAINFNAKVVNVAFDSRSDILATIGVKSIKFNDYLSNKFNLTSFVFNKDMSDIKQEYKDRFIKLWYDKVQKIHGYKLLTKSKEYISKDYWTSGKISNYSGIIKTVYPRIQKILDKIIELSPDNVLELGCASGASVNYLIEHNINTVGVDLSHYAVEQGRKIFNIPITSGSIHDLSQFNDDQFDMIYSQQVLEHLPTELVPLLTSEISRVLKVTGVALLFLVIGYKDQVAKAEDDVDKTHWNLKTKEWWINQFKKVCLYEDVDLDRQFEKLVPFKEIHRLVLRKWK